MCPFLVPSRIPADAAELCGTLPVRQVLIAPYGGAVTSSRNDRIESRHDSRPDTPIPKRLRIRTAEKEVRVVLATVECHLPQQETLDFASLGLDGRRAASPHGILYCGRCPHKPPPRAPRLLPHTCK